MAKSVRAAASDFLEVCGAGSNPQPTDQRGGHFAIRVDTPGLCM